MADSASSIDLNVPPIKFPKSESQKNSEMNFFSRDLSNETPGVPSSYSLELDDLRTFKDSMESFVAKEKAREIDERSYLPDPDLMRACMSASGASFEICMDCLRSSLSVTADDNLALLRAIAEAAKVNPKALEFVVSKGSATLSEAVKALLDEGGDGDDTIAAIERVMVNRREEVERRAREVESDTGSVSRPEGKKGDWKEKDKVAVMSGGEWWEGVVTRVMPRRTGTQYECKFTDGSKQVVGGESVKELDEGED